MNYPFSENNWICRILGHRYGPMYVALGHVRTTCKLDGHTVPRWPKVPQDRADYEDWLARGAPKDDLYGDWIPREGQR